MARFKAEARNKMLYDDYKKGCLVPELEEKYGIKKSYIYNIIGHMKKSDPEFGGSPEPEKKEGLEEAADTEKKEEPEKKDEAVEDEPKQKVSFYNLDNILSKKARYNVIFASRSNGKTYAVLLYGLKRYLENGYEMVYMRREDLDLKPGTGGRCFENIVANGEVEKLTNGKWNSIYYFAQQWYLAKIDDQGNRVTAPTPFCYGIPITGQHHFKSAAFPRVRTLIFDEFAASKYYTNEFVDFLNLVSTIVRNGTDKEGNFLSKEEMDEYKIFLTGNLNSPYSIYFDEMGLYNVRKQALGTIEMYEYGESGLTVAVERCGLISSTPKPSDVFFAFNNPKLRAITDGEWELPMYPHLPMNYTGNDILMTFFVLFKENTIMCDVVEKDDCRFIYAQRKTTPLKHPDDELVYSPEWSPKPNYRRSLKKAFSECERKIQQLINMGKIYFCDNDCGSAFETFMNRCD